VTNIRLANRRNRMMYVTREIFNLAIPANNFHERVKMII